MKRLQVLPDDFGRRKVPLDESGMFGFAAQSFDSDGSRTGKQVENEFSRDPPSHQIEYGFPNVVFHRAGDWVAGIGDLLTAVDAPDNSKFSDLSFGLVRFPAIEIPTFFDFCHWICCNFERQRALSECPVIVTCSSTIIHCRSSVHWEPFA